MSLGGTELKGPVKGNQLPPPQIHTEASAIGAHPVLQLSLFWPHLHITAQRFPWGGANKRKKIKINQFVLYPLLLQSKKTAESSYC